MTAAQLIHNAFKKHSKKT
uniref:Uncharacterized protein n=1 Tax=Anguilla anguilla TaxID=7936 RepID=A0A0E9P5J5_ANGAN